jgi:hypothetical protein
VTSKSDKPGWIVSMRALRHACGGGKYGSEPSAIC